MTRITAVLLISYKIVLAPGQTQPATCEVHHTTFFDVHKKSSVVRYYNCC